MLHDSILDTSLEDFFTNLRVQINNSKIQHSFIDYKYEKLNHKNKLYESIESYKNDKTIFYSDFLTKYPGINIIRIGEIKLGNNYYTKGRGAYPDGTYHLNFTIYFEK